MNERLPRGERPSAKAFLSGKGLKSKAELLLAMVSAQTTKEAQKKKKKKAA